MNSKIRTIFCTLFLISLAACNTKKTNESDKIVLIFKSEGVFMTNALPAVYCQAVASHHDADGFVVFIKGGLFNEVKSFLQIATGNSGIDLGTNKDGFEGFVFNKSESHPAFLVTAKANGIQIMGIRQ